MGLRSIRCCALNDRADLWPVCRAAGGRAGSVMDETGSTGGEPSSLLTARDSNPHTGPEWPDRNNLARKVAQHDRQIAVLFEHVQKMLAPAPVKKKPIGFGMNQALSLEGKVKRVSLERRDRDPHIRYCKRQGSRSHDNQF